MQTALGSNKAKERRIFLSSKIYSYVENIDNLRRKILRRDRSPPQFSPQTHWCSLSSVRVSATIGLLFQIELTLLSLVIEQITVPSSFPFIPSKISKNYFDSFLQENSSSRVKIEIGRLDCIRCDFNSLVRLVTRSFETKVDQRKDDIGIDINFWTSFIVRESTNITRSLNDQQCWFYFVHSIRDFFTFPLLYWRYCRWNKLNEKLFPKGRGNGVCKNLFNVISPPEVRW